MNQLLKTAEFAVLRSNKARQAFPEDGKMIHTPSVTRFKVLHLNVNRKGRAGGGGNCQSREKPQTLRCRRS